MPLSVRSLSCVRGGRDVLRDVSFEVEDGGTLLLRGPNGVGKSSLLRALSGLIASSGDVVLNGLGRDGEPDQFAEQIAFAGHLDAVKPQLTVQENLSFWDRLFEGSGIAAAVDAFDLGGFIDRPTHMCSAGQRRRLGLARLVVARRSLWLLDEPTVSLDAQSCARFASVLDAHTASGGIAVVATHTELGVSRSDVLELKPVFQLARDGEPEDPFLSGDLA